MLTWAKKKTQRALVKLSGWAASQAEALDAPKSVRSGAAFATRMSGKKQIWFVTDIPLFIDDVAVRQLYDALHRPEFETVSRNQADTWSEGTQSADKAGLGAEVGFAPVLKGKGSVQSSKGRSSKKGGATSLDQEANRSAEMRLEQILWFYEADFPHRVLWTSVDSPVLEDLNGESKSWTTVDEMLEHRAPRPLIVLDLKHKSKLLPMMSETVDGKIQELYQVFRESTGKQSELPEYPSDTASGGDQEAKKYWRALDDVFDSRVAMRVVENATSAGSRIEWIDFRLIGKPSADELLPMHLHLCPRGRYSTGTFAYQTIRRGYKHGLRMVGTLKKGEDINVLAVYEV
jgi:hypothetical protein